MKQYKILANSTFNINTIIEDYPLLSMEIIEIMDSYLSMIHPIIKLLGENSWIITYSKLVKHISPDYFSKEQVPIFDSSYINGFSAQVSFINNSSLSSNNYIDISIFPYNKNFSLSLRLNSYNLINIREINLQNCYPEDCIRNLIFFLTLQKLLILKEGSHFNDLGIEKKDILINSTIPTKNMNSISGFLIDKATVGIESTSCLSLSEIKTLLFNIGNQAIEGYPCLEKHLREKIYIQ